MNFNKTNFFNVEFIIVSVLIMVIFFFTPVSPTFAKEKPLNLKVGFYQNTPKIFLDTQGRISGFWPDLLAYIAEKENWKIEYIKGTWEQGLKRLTKGEIDIMPDVGFSEERAEIYIFSKGTVLTSWSRIYVNKTNKNISCILDLKNKKIAGLKGSINFEGRGGFKSISRKFDLNCSFMEFDNYKDVFKAVEDKIVNAGITNRNFGNRNENKYRVKNTGIIFQPVIIKFAFPKNSFLTPFLVKKINADMATLKSDNNSYYFQLLNKYFESPVGEKTVLVFPAWARVVVLIIIILLAVFCIALVIASLKIKKDISEIKAKNKLLKERRDGYRRLLDESPVSIILFDRQGIVTFVNKWHLKIFAKNRYKHDFFVGEKITELPGIKSAGAGPDIEKVLSGEMVIMEELFTPVFSGGKGGYINIKAVPVFFDDDFNGGILIAEDISEKKLVRKKMEEQRLFFKSIIDSIPNAVFIKDHEAKVIFVNKKGKDVFKMPEDKILDRTVLDLMKNKKIAQKIYREDMEILTGKKKKIKYRISYTDASSCEYWTFVEKMPLIENSDSDNRNDDKKVLTILTDITETKKLEENFLQAQKMESVGILAGGVAHDFNNILTIINGRSDLALMDIDDTDPVYQDIKEIRTAGERAANLVRQLLAFSRREIYRPELVDMNKIIDGIEKMLRRMIGENIEMALFLHENPLYVKADPGQIEQIFMNLVVNARDAILARTDKASEMEITIETGEILLDDKYVSTHPGSKEGLHVYFSVSDTGIGMDRTIRKNIFSPFFTTKGQGKGTGLGLSTVYGIVKQNKGSVYVYSEPGKGTTLRIYWPCAEEQQGKKYQLPPRREERIFKGNETILLAEDDEPLRLFTKKLLNNMGYTVYEASNGKKALKLSEFIKNKEKITVDLLMTDIIMPEMDGRELADELKRRHSDLKVLFTSGYTDNHIVKNGLLTTETNFIQKPFNAKTLSKKIREVLDS